MEDAGRDRFSLPAAKGVLASRLSMKPETFSRILHNLSVQGVIEVKSSTIEVLQVAKLRELAHLESIIGLEPESPAQNPCPLAGPKPL
jgi:hypothetical protein